MADFPPNLDDGEFYLPSDIYPPEFPTIFSSNSTTETTPQFPSELTYMQDLAEQLARENMVFQQTPKLPPNPPQVLFSDFCFSYFNFWVFFVLLSFFLS